MDSRLALEPAGELNAEQFAQPVTDRFSLVDAGEALHTVPLPHTCVDLTGPQVLHRQGSIEPLSGFEGHSLLEGQRPHAGRRAACSEQESDQ